MEPSLLAPVIPFWIKQRAQSTEAATNPRQSLEAQQLQPDAPTSDFEPPADLGSSEADTLSASLDAADVGLRKAQKTVAAIVGKVDLAIREPDRRDELGGDVDMLKDRLRSEIDEAERDGTNWLTLDFGQIPDDKTLPRQADDADGAAASSIILISSADAEDGIFTRSYGASEEQEFGGYFLISDDAASGQDLSREISISSDTSEVDLKAMRAALTSVTADLARAGDRLDQARTASARTPVETPPSRQPGSFNQDIDTLLASITRDALRAQALNIMNGDGDSLKRLLAG
jgi:hypothetical protein